MYHFFVTSDAVGENEIRITGADVNHIKNVLRMRLGEQITVADGTGREYRCAVKEIYEDTVTAEIYWEYEAQAELPIRVTVYQGLPKADKMELIVQKCVELGAVRIVPVVTARSVVRLDAKKAVARVKRWQEIALSAAKQSGRSVIPEVGDVMDFRNAVEEAEKLDRIFIPYERAKDMASTRRAFGEITGGESVGIFIGPEGGFEDREVDLAVNAGAKPLTLGRRILRTETAGPAVMAVLGYLTEE